MAKKFKKQKRDIVKDVKDYVHYKGYDRFVTIPEEIGGQYFPSRPYDPIEGIRFFVSGDEDNYDQILKGIENSFDKKFNESYKNGELMLKGTPQPIIYAYPRIHLFTYPISEGYPITHSSIKGPDGFKIDKRGYHNGYNLITNNCSNATGLFLADLLGLNGKFVNGISTPERVRDAIGEVNIKGMYERKPLGEDGPIETVIPLNLEMLDRFTILRNYDYNNR